MKFSRTENHGAARIAMLVRNFLCPYQKVSLRRLENLVDQDIYEKTQKIGKK